jgi:hypothetical protein
MNYLKPLAYCKPSSETDKAIIDILVDPRVNLLKYEHFKIIIKKVNAHQYIN